MTSTHFDSRNLLVIWDGAGESLTESVHKSTLFRVGCQKCSSYHCTNLPSIHWLHQECHHSEAFSTIFVLEYLIFALESALFIIPSSLVHDIEGSAPKSEDQEANRQVFVVASTAQQRTIQSASGHKFTPYSRGWLLRLSTFWADSCLTGGSPKSICSYELLNHYSISAAPLAPSINTAIEKEPSESRQARNTHRQYQNGRTIGDIWQQQMRKHGNCEREVCRRSGRWVSSG